MVQWTAAGPGDMLLLLLLSQLGRTAASTPPGRADDAADNHKAASRRVVVYGATAAGVTAAVAAARELGASGTVTLIEPRRNVGGMVSGGLGKSDVGIASAIGGQAEAFFAHIGSHYNLTLPRESRSEEGVPPRPCHAPPCYFYAFEPKVAEAYFRRMLRESNVGVVFSEHALGVTMSNGRIVALRTSSGESYTADTFVDATYEGELLVFANVSNIVGRESSAQYDESMGGARAALPLRRGDSGGPTCDCSVSPFKTAGDPSSGTLFTVTPGQIPAPGSADKRTQAYDFRLCLTNDTENMRAHRKPDRYDPSHYELLRRQWQRAMGANGSRPESYRWCFLPDSHGGYSKTDNNGDQAPTIGPRYNWEYARSANFTRRMEIWAELQDFALGYLWFLQTDQAVDAGTRAFVGGFGFPKDEFEQTGGFPHQLYVREGRRMVADYVMTQSDVLETRVKADSVGVGSYDFDVHLLERTVCSCTDGSHGLAREAGGGLGWIGGRRLFEIPYRSIVPKRGQASNLLVPITMSASHVAFAAIRVEPTYMVLGEAAGVAAAMSAAGTPAGPLAVQDVDVAELQRKLRQAGAVLNISSAGPLPPPPPGPVIAGCPAEWQRCVPGLAPSTAAKKCDSACRGLGASEWLANAGYWTVTASSITATRATVLKKSLANSATLPTSGLLRAKAGQQFAVTGAPVKGSFNFKGRRKGEATAYWLVNLSNPQAMGKEAALETGGPQYWDGTWCLT